MKKILLLTVITAGSMLSTNIQGMNFARGLLKKYKTPITSLAATAFVCSRCGHDSLKPDSSKNEWQRFLITAERGDHFWAPDGRLLGHDGRIRIDEHNPDKDKPGFIKKSIARIAFSKENPRGEKWEDIQTDVNDTTPFDASTWFNDGHPYVRKATVVSDVASKDEPLRVEFEINMERCRWEIREIDPVFGHLPAFRHPALRHLADPTVKNLLCKKEADSEDTVIQLFHIQQIQKVVEAKTTLEEVVTDRPLYYYAK